MENAFHIPEQNKTQQNTTKPAKNQNAIKKSKPKQTNAYKIKNAKTPQEIFEAIKNLPEAEQTLENELQRTAWFSYRAKNHIDRTIDFIQTYDKIYLRHINLNAGISPRQRKSMQMWGHWLKRDELMAPWVKQEKNKTFSSNPRWIHWIKARREADRRSMLYEDYISGALISSQRRGWSRWPTPTSLYSKKLLGGEDEFHDATIPAYEVKKYEDRVKTTDDPYYTAKHYQEDPNQVCYYHWLASEVERLHPRMFEKPSQRAERVWKQFQTDGKIPSCIGLDAALSSLNQ